MFLPTAGRLCLTTAGRLCLSTAGRLCLSTAGRLSLSTAVLRRQTGRVHSRQRRLLFFWLFYLVINNEIQLLIRVLIDRLCLSVHSNVRAMSPRHATGDIVLPTLLLMRGRRSRRRSAVDVAVVVVAPATITSVGHIHTWYTSGCSFSSSSYECGIRKHTHNNIEYGVQRTQGLNRHKPRVQRR